MIHYRSRERQEGAVLVVALMFLVVLTMLGVTAMTGTTFEERMAGNARDASVARNAAEAGLRAARNLLLGITVPHGSAILRTDAADTGTGVKKGGPMITAFMQSTDANGACVEGVCTARSYTRGVVGLVPPDLPAGVDWSEGDNKVPGATTEIYAKPATADALQGVSKQPRFIMELFCIPLAAGGLDGASDDCRVYRFTAVGWGKNPNTQVMVQEFYIAESDKK